MPQHQPTLPDPGPGPFAAFIGIDWADRQHAVCVLADGELTRHTLPHTPQDIAEWVEQLQERWGEAPLAVALEQKRGPLINALVQYSQLVLFPINPKQLARYREALFPSGAKDDPQDAQLLARFVQDHHQDLRPLRSEEPRVRRLATLCQLRRKAVDTRKKMIQQLTDILKQYFPLVLELPGTLSDERTLALLARWPTHQKLRRAHPQTLQRFLKDHGMRGEKRREGFVRHVRSALPLTGDRALIEPAAQWAQTLVRQIRALNVSIGQFEEQIEQLFADHQDAELFSRLPGAGPALAPRLAAAFGSDRSRFASAEEVAATTGVAPVTRRSGRSTVIKKRVFCPKFLRQTFHEFADHSRLKSRWARAYYQLQRSRGKQHHAALRALAFKWIRILYQVWKTRTPYDEDRYLQQLHKQNSPLLPFLKTAS